MSCMYKIGVIGDYDSICGFGALGLDIYPAGSAEECAALLKRLAGGEYGILYVTEPLIEQLPELFEKYRQRRVPAVIPIPSSRGATGFGVAQVKRYVEQAVGSDIIFNED